MVQKYHVPIMKLYPTPEEIPDFAFYLKIGTLLVSSSVKHIPLMTDLSKRDIYCTIMWLLFR